MCGTITTKLLLTLQRLVIYDALKDEIKRTKRFVSIPFRTDDKPQAPLVQTGSGDRLEMGHLITFEKAEKKVTVLENANFLEVLIKG